MARQKNSVETVQITISVTEKVRDQLEVLTSTGYYGKNAAETANSLIAERIRQLVESTSPLLASVG
jgi:hypothetical protein